MTSYEERERLDRQAEKILRDAEREHRRLIDPKPWIGRVGALKQHLRENRDRINKAEGEQMMRAVIGRQRSKRKVDASAGVPLAAQPRKRNHKKKANVGKVHSKKRTQAQSGGRTGGSYSAKPNDLRDSGPNGKVVTRQMTEEDRARAGRSAGKRRESTSSD